MKHVFEAFVYFGEGLYFEDGIPLYTGNNRMDFERKSYIGETWAEVFLEVFRDYCNQKNLRPRNAIIGATAKDGWQSYHHHKSPTNNTVYVPVYFDPKRTVVFGIEETKVHEGLSLAYLHGSTE